MRSINQIRPSLWLLGQLSGLATLVDIEINVRQSTRHLWILLLPVVIIGLGYTVSFDGPL
jgi:hypothetical protein